ncbi:dTDP-4-dehydrorhamnose reductase [Acuticoccus sp. I52.16.1]|uniref:dTDP-4-dehydrorhamnose reductase n=1 Tax=Acuticoccus sp. I52.16.1 TaxID=2928472 RepID=UPI001FD11BFB|nr:dTDP-4-dehydrorhamnose reductase [Acuticoccus sp. I52.16.1]UOM37321.1 dTDP-4-dehydrorhamnose reductase [Acuticoccus sp. I52.16.1]
MKILVIGRSGQVARALVERARVERARVGHAGPDDVVALGRPEADLTRPESLARALERTAPEVVVNAAAYTAVDAAESDEAAAAALNAEGPGALAALCAAAAVPLIHISTDYVFDGTLERPYREDDPLAPASAYGRTKAAGEAAVRAAGGRHLIARTAWVYSPYGKNFVKTMLRLGAERDRLTVVNDQHGNPTSALDIADTLLALAHRHAAWPAGGEVVHVAGRGDTTWRDFAAAIVASLPAPPRVAGIPTSQYPTPARRPANSRLDTARLATRYGLTLPDWPTSLRVVLDRLAADPDG